MREFIKVKEDTQDKFNFWRVKHNEALVNPQHGFETAILMLLDGVEEYRFRYNLRFESHVEDDGVLGDGLAEIVKGIRTLLNGEIGRLDAGTIDGYLVNILRKCGETV